MSKKLWTSEVVNEQGVIALKGQVDSPEIREAAEEIAANQSGVSAVINMLEVKPKTRSFWNSAIPLR
jgi:osmotically-inducible protein OsmY